jgi:hypothetical protein
VLARGPLGLAGALGFRRRLGVRRADRAAATSSAEITRIRFLLFVACSNRTWPAVVAKTV